MSDADYHTGCDSYAQVSAADAAGPFDYVLGGHEHPASARYPNVKVVSCELAAEHGGRCEMFVDYSQAENLSYWITWQRRAWNDEPATQYEWIKNAQCCDAASPHGYRCTRPADHIAGHAFTAAP